MSNEYAFLAPITELLPADRWPGDLNPGDGGTVEGLLSNIYFTDYQLFSIENGLGFEVIIVITEEVSIEVPGLQGTTLALGGEAGAGTTSFRVTAFLGEGGFEIWVEDIEVALRFPPNILRPVAEREGSIPPRFVEIALHGVVSVDQNLDFKFEGLDSVSLSPAMIGDSGVVVSASDVQLDLSSTETLPEVLDAGFDESFIGVFVGEAQVRLPEGMPALAPEDLILRNSAIGAGGVSGRLEAHYSPSYNSDSKTFSGQGADELFGIPFGLHDVWLVFEQNAFKESRMIGQLLLPFFDKPLAVEIGLDLAGGFAVKLIGAVDETDNMGNNGLLTLTKRGLFTLTVDSLAFEVKNGEFAAKLAGTLQPDVADLDWPAVKINEMIIYADGRVDLDGGWLNLPEQQRLDFHGFSTELTQVGFGGTDDRYRWIGFSGSIQLVADLGLGARFDGLRIEWPSEGPVRADTIRLSLEGVGIDLTILDVLAFKGTVRFINDTANVQQGFKGGVKLTLYSINLTIDAELLVIKERHRDTGEEFTAFYLYVNSDFPAGIPLASTGVAVYGLAGLLGQNVEPDKGDQEQWYENWYKGNRLVAGGGTSRGVAASDKWDATQGSQAFGAGVTLGTATDNGFAVNGKLLLVLILPGPIILLEGRANLLTERSKLAGAGEPTFEALAVLDGQAGQFLMNVAAQYKKDSAGRIIDIRAGAEAFFDYHRADAWHLYLGQNEPREKRIRASVLSLFEADSYLMLSARDLQLGFWVGFDEHWDFGPLEAGLEAWIAADAAVSWKPVHVHGQLQLHGGIELSAFGFGASIGVDARIAADAPTPFHVLAELHVELGLPWPLPDLEATVGLELGEENIPLPPVPLALGAASCKHLKVSEKWPLDRLPRYDGNRPDDSANPNGPGFWHERELTAEQRVDMEAAELVRAYDEDQDAFLGVPVVPLDVRPVLSFAKPVFDDVGFGHKREGLVEQVGEHSFEYHLVQLKLEKQRRSTDDGWQTVAVRGAHGYGPEDHAERLRGTWQLVNDGDDALPNAKLTLWSKTTYDWAREQAGPMYWTWVQGHLSDAFCPPPSPRVQRCAGWDKVKTGTRYKRGFVVDRLEFKLSQPTVQMDVVYRPCALFDRLRALRLAAATNDLQIVELSVSRFPYGTTKVSLSLEAPASVTVVAYHQGNQVASREHQPGAMVLSVEAKAIDRVVLRTRVLPPAQPDKNAYLYRICYEAPLNPDRQQVYIEWVNSVDETREIWHSTDTLLEPDHYYRLTVATEVYRDGDKVKQDPFTEHIYFQTGQPPGIYAPSNDRDASQVNNPHEHYPDKGPLKDLRPYVQYTVPAPEARAVYRAYDIGAYFNENYVDAMYRLARKPLKVLLYDAKGNLVTGLVNRWGENPTLTLTHTEMQWLYSLDQATCLDSLDLHELPPDQHLKAYGPGLLLRPETLYEARLVADGGHDDQYAVYKWRFITSRFAHFRHHIGSFRDYVWDGHILRGRPDTPLLTPEQRDRLETLVTAEREGLPVPAGDAPRFEEIAYLFGFGTQPRTNQPGRWLRPIPRRVELTFLRDANRRYGLLLESPEPLDPLRVTVEARYNDTLAPHPHTPGEAKILDARLAPLGNRVNEEYLDILLLQDLDLSHWVIEHTGSADPNNATFSAYYTFPAGPAFKEGILIRLHSGRADLDPVAGRAAIYQHRYVEADVFQLNRDGDTLRLADARANTTHSRFFRSPEAYTRQANVIVWNTDHTAAFLFFPEGATAAGSVPDGQYRLICTFKRTLAGHPTLKQEDEADDELANLDFVIGTMDSGP